MKNCGQSARQQHNEASCFFSLGLQLLPPNPESGNTLHQETDKHKPSSEAHSKPQRDFHKKLDIAPRISTPVQPQTLPQVAEHVLQDLVPTVPSAWNFLDSSHEWVTSHLQLRELQP